MTDTILKILNSQAEEGPGCEGTRDFHYPTGMFAQADVEDAFNIFLATGSVKEAGITITYEGRRHGDDWYLLKWPLVAAA